jgi:ssDNA-binding Zn-finger/Zn-ribbon topoisomerase 1
VKCPYCGAKAKCEDSSRVYKGRSYGMAWICSNYPTCNAYVGCHPGTMNALGPLADSDLREWRRAAHGAFDPFWKSGHISRKEAYRWLARQLGRTIHIGGSDAATCEEIIRVCQMAQSEIEHRVNIARLVTGNMEGVQGTDGSDGNH